MKKFALIKSAIISAVIALFLGELFFQAFLFGYHIMYAAREDNCGDACPMLVFFFLGFLVKPAGSFLLAAIIYLLYLAKSGVFMPIGFIDAAKITLIQAVIGIFVLMASIGISVFEAKVPISEIPGIYSMFFRLT